MPETMGDIRAEVIHTLGTRGSRRARATLATISCTSAGDRMACRDIRRMRTVDIRWRATKKAMPKTQIAVGVGGIGNRSWRMAVAKPALNPLHKRVADAQARPAA